MRQNNQPHPRRPPTRTRPQPSTADQGQASALRTQDPPPALHTPAEAARLLTVRESWLRRQAGHRAIPCTFLGKHLRFSDADLRAIVETGARPPHSRSRQSGRP